MSEQEINKFSNDVYKLLSDINKCCAKIAERDGFNLPEIGGWVKKDGEWQWLTCGYNPQ